MLTSQIDRMVFLCPQLLQRKGQARWQERQFKGDRRSPLDYGGRGVYH